MDKNKMFLRIQRKEQEYRPVNQRLRDYKEVFVLKSPETSQEQSLRCMGCGTSFCHWACPLGNYIPEWNGSLASGKWRRAFDFLRLTNNFPEITGRLCPGICEYSCVLGINDEPVTIRENELAVIEYGFKKGWVSPQPPRKRSGKRVLVVGSGPAGLAVADQLNKAGHMVVVIERQSKPGGLLRYGIPDFKLEKWVLDRRLEILKKEGIAFKTSIELGSSDHLNKNFKEFDAVCIAVGSTVPRDIDIPGRDLKGIHFAMDYLAHRNRETHRERVSSESYINAKGKKVVVIGGGDTGSDCVGTALRQFAKCVVQIELMPKPSKTRTKNFPWPAYPLLLKTSSSHQEGGARKWAVISKEFKGENGLVKKISCGKANFLFNDKSKNIVIKEAPETNFEIEADLVIIAAGFMHTEHRGLVGKLGIKFDERGNIKTSSSYMTNIAGVFAAGDARKGQSLIAYAIAEGRRAAYHIDFYLRGKSNLPLL